MEDHFSIYPAYSGVAFSPHAAASYVFLHGRFFPPGKQTSGPDAEGRPSIHPSPEELGDSAFSGNWAGDAKRNKISYFLGNIYG